MLENLYTTKMSASKKTLQNRFAKIRRKSGWGSKIMALIMFSVILLVMAASAIIIAAHTKSGKDLSGEYAMTESEFYEYLSRPIGSEMAELDYADENRIVFHYGEGFFVGNPQSGAIEHMINLKKLNISPNSQGSSVFVVRIDRDGKYAYLSSDGAADEIKGSDDYIVNLDDGKIKKGSTPGKTKLFAGTAETFSTVKNAVGWYSVKCVANKGKTYYLTAQTWAVRDIELVTVNHEKAEFKYVFADASLPAEEIAEISPSDIKNIKSVHLAVDGINYPLGDSGRLSEIVKTFSSASEIKGGTNCPFNAELVFVGNGGTKGKVWLASDSCAIFKSGGSFYKYGGDNSALLGYFGLDPDSLTAVSRKSELYIKTSEFLKSEFYRVYKPYYDIQSLTVSNWQERGNEATFLYKMTYLNYNRDPDKAEYIQEAKKRSQKEYETLYNDYLALKDSSYQFKVVLNGDTPELYYNTDVAPNGTKWERVTVDDFISSN